MTQTSPAALLGAEQWDQTAAQTGRTYRIFVSRPALPAPAAGYPLVLIPDGNLLFPIAAQVAPIWSLAGEIQPAVVVGVGYPIEGLFDYMALRAFDLTPATPEDCGHPAFPGPYGGADAFLGFLKDELTPRLAAAIPIDQTDISLLGNAGGGLLALHALFHQPTAFRSFVAASPAIFWNGGAVLKAEAEFAARVRGGQAAPRVMITVGACEQSIDDYTISARFLPDWTPELGQREAIKLRMVDNARELAARLAELPTEHGFETAFAELNGETHSSVIAANVSRGLGFALRLRAS